MLPLRQIGYDRIAVAACGPDSMIQVAMKSVAKNITGGSIVSSLAGRHLEKRNFLTRWARSHFVLRKLIVCSLATNMEN
jgi:hypothetical protein